MLLLRLLYQSSNGEVQAIKHDTLTHALVLVFHSSDFRLACDLGLDNGDEFTFLRGP